MVRLDWQSWPNRWINWLRGPKRRHQMNPAIGDCLQDRALLSASLQLLTPQVGVAFVECDVECEFEGLSDSQSSGSQSDAPDHEDLRDIDYTFELLANDTSVVETVVTIDASEWESGADLSGHTMEDETPESEHSNELPQPAPIRPFFETIASARRANLLSNLYLNVADVPNSAGELLITVPQIRTTTDRAHPDAILSLDAPSIPDASTAGSVRAAGADRRAGDTTLIEPRKLADNEVEGRLPDVDQRRQDVVNSLFRNPRELPEDDVIQPAGGTLPSSPEAPSLPINREPEAVVPKLAEPSDRLENSDAGPPASVAPTCRTERRSLPLSATLPSVAGLTTVANARPFWQRAIHRLLRWKRLAS